MSVLRIQTLVVRDCARRVHREYYEWGRNKLDHTPEPVWRNASREQRRAITWRGYDLYDGFPAKPGDEVGLPEIYASVGIFSRVILNDAVRILARAEAARPLLARIPDGACLEDATDDQLIAAGEVVDIFAAAQQVGRGKATKVLHKKRPHFMPILDSVVFDFLWKNFPHVLREGSPTSDYLSVYREVLLARRSVLALTRAELAGKGLALSTTRVLDFLLWLGWRGKVDEFGFGPPITKVWKVASLGAARAKALRSWEVMRIDEGAP